MLVNGRQHTQRMATLHTRGVSRAPSLRAHTIQPTPSRATTATSVNVFTLPTLLAHRTAYLLRLQQIIVDRRLKPLIATRRITITVALQHNHISSMRQNIAVSQCTRMLTERPTIGGPSSKPGRIPMPLRLATPIRTLTAPSCLTSADMRLLHTRESASETTLDRRQKIVTSTSRRSIVEMSTMHTPAKSSPRTVAELTDHPDCRRSRS